MEKLSSYADVAMFGWNFAGKIFEPYDDLF
jgi:hypothetical protein